MKDKYSSEKDPDEKKSSINKDGDYDEEEDPRE